MIGLWILTSIAFIVWHIILIVIELKKETKQCFLKFALPSLSDGNNVVLTQSDVLDNFEFEFFKFFQDKCYNGSKIYIAAGMGNHQSITKIRVLDLTTKQIITVIPLGDTYNSEPEGLDIYNGKLLMTYGE